MQFEIPKFETPRFDAVAFNDEGPDDLPAELAEVAAQLSADANWLSATYPSKVAAPLAIPMTPARSSKNYWALVAAVLIAVGVTGWWQLTGDRAEVPQVVRVTPPAEVAASPEEPTTKQAVVPPVVFQELSSPEQEAVLDLLEGQASSLSI